MRISDWSSDVCSSDLRRGQVHRLQAVLVGLPVRRARILAGRGRDEEMHALRGPDLQREPGREIGSASCRERECQYVSISVVAVSLKKKKKQHIVMSNN